MNKKILFSSLIASLACIPFGINGMWQKKYPVSPEQEEAFTKLISYITTLQNNIDGLLDKAEKEGWFEGDRIKNNLETWMPQLATKQGLLFVSALNRLRFQMITPKGLLNLGGYNPSQDCAINIAVEKEIREKVLAMIEGELFPQYTSEAADSWADEEVYKVHAVNGEKIPHLIRGKKPTDSMYNEVVST